MKSETICVEKNIDNNTIIFDRTHTMENGALGGLIPVIGTWKVFPTQWVPTWKTKPLTGWRRRAVAACKVSRHFFKKETYRFGYVVDDCLVVSFENYDLICKNQGIVK